MRILHTMFRVKDLEKSMAFYKDILGMRLFRKKDYPEGKFTIVYMGYGDENNSHAIELVYNWDHRSYDLGDAFGHVAIGVDDIYTTCERLKEKGANLTREPGPMKHGATVIAFIKDPDGYQIELIGNTS